MSDLRKLLDDLDAAREKATPGEWVHNPVNGVHTPIGACIATSHRHDDEKRRADAALIVAAVNNLGPLVAIVREFWDEHDGRTCHDRTADSHNGVTPCPTRTFIASEFGDVQ